MMSNRLVTESGFPTSVTTGSMPRPAAAVFSSSASRLPARTTWNPSWASAMLAAGVGVPAVTRLGGWSDAALVHRRYGHALPDELAGAGQALERFRQARAAAIGPALVPQDGASL